MSCSICNVFLEESVVEKCGHKFHPMCHLVAMEVGATGCPCCPGNEVNEFLMDVNNARKRVAELDEHLNRMDNELEAREESATDYNKYIVDDRHDIIKFSVLELVFEEYVKDVNRYNMFMKKVFAERGKNCKKEIVEFNEKMKNKDIIQTEYYSLRFDMEYKYSEVFGNLEIFGDKSLDIFIRNNPNDYYKLAILKANFEMVSKEF
jgi:hypothetical protein